MYCYCKKNFHSTLTNSSKISATNRNLFSKDIIYEFLKEDDDFIWVIYNKYGDFGESGVRFHTHKNEYKICNIYSFYDYFLTERGTKLKILNNNVIDR